MLRSDVEGTSEQWMTQLPAILIVTSSLLIDRSLRKDLIEERVRCQIWLWFCVILSLRSHPNTIRINNDKDDIIHISKEDLICETWMHLIIVSNLASIGVLAISGPLERIKKSNMGSWWFSFAAWTAMMSSCLFAPLGYAEGTQDSSIAMLSLQVYVISLCILAMIHWHKRRREKMEQEMRKIMNYGGRSNNPSSSSFAISQDLDGFDRSKWYTWKASTTLKWISHVLDDDDDVDHGVLQQLASHRIDGSLLDTLSISQLLQLQVPYGPACHLDQAIQTELVRPFPKPRGADDMRNNASFRGGTTTPAAAQSDFLSGFDQEYNNSDRPRNLASNSSNSSNSNKETTSSGLADRNSFASGPEMLSLDPNQEDRIQDVMKERYGLELPRLRTEGASTEPDSSTSQSSSVTDGEHPLQQTAPTEKKSPPSALPTPEAVPIAAAMPNLESAVVAGGEIPEVILKQMPANIREIAKRRPDVVRQLLFSKQQKLQEQQHLQQQQQKQFHREDNLYAHAEEGEYIHEKDNDDSNDETSRLIRRKKDHREYKSTGL